MNHLLATGSLTIMRTLAAYSFGRWSVTWPDSVPEDVRPDPGEGFEFGYVADLGRNPGRFGRRFAREDAMITAAEYDEQRQQVANSGSSNVEFALDTAAKRTAGSPFIENTITRAGLNGNTPWVDFDVDDIVPVQIFGKTLSLPVTQIVAKTEQGAVIDWDVFVGGSLLADTVERERANLELRQEIAKERRERQQITKTIASDTRRAGSIAAEAISKAGSALAAASGAVVQSGVEYAVSDSETTPPVSGWSTTAPTRTDGAFIWQRMIVTYGDDRTERTEPVLVTGNTGEPGVTWSIGAISYTFPQKKAELLIKGKVAGTLTGVGLGVWVVDPETDAVVFSQVYNTYSGSTSDFYTDFLTTVRFSGEYVGKIVVFATMDASTADEYVIATLMEVGALSEESDYTKYLYAKGRVPFVAIGQIPPSRSDGVIGGVAVDSAGDGKTLRLEAPYSLSGLVARGAKGEKGATGARGAKGDTGADGLPGKDGTKLVKTVITYAVSSSGVTAPSSGWVSSPPAASAGQFVWTRSVWTYSDGTSETGYSVGKIGNTGAQGISITSVTRFWQWAASKPAVPTGTATPSGWSTTQPAYVMGQTLWTTTRTVMSNNTASWTPVSEEASVSAATAISAESANNRNRIWYSTADPGTTKGERPGDTWYKYSGSSIIGMWRWSGSAWVAESIAHQAIASVDAGKISTGILNAQRIGAGTIDATKLTITPGNLFPDPHFKDPSWLGVANVTTSTANGGELKITATGSQLGRYYQPSGLADKSMTLEAGAAYRLTANVYMLSTISPKNVAVYMRYLRTDGSVKVQFLGNLVGVSGSAVSALNFTTPSAMKDGTCTLGFYLQATNAAGQGYVRVWDVQLTRAADASLIVDGAIQAHHIAANTLTADMVKAGEIIVGDQGESVVNQIDELDSRLWVVADDLNTMKTLMEEYTSKETGFGYKSSSGTVTGSANTLNYFSGGSQSLAAKGNWVGRFTFLSFEHGDASLFEVGANRGFSVPGNALFWWEKDPLKITTSTKTLASVFEPKQSTWTNLPGFSWTVPDGATRITWSLKVVFTNVHRGSTYGIRVMQGTRVLYTYQTNDFGPLTALGNPTWYMSRSGEATLSGTSPVTLQVYCTNSVSSKRRVTTTTNMTAKIVSPT